MKEEKKTISSETDKIDGLTADISSLGEDIASLEADIKKMETAADKAKNVRDDEKSLYDEEQKNFEDTITAVDEAITTLKDSKASLLQTNAKVEKVKALAETLGKPAAKTYSFKSGGIIETFKAMKAEFEADKLDSTSAETNKLNAYNLAKQERDTAISTAASSKSEKEGIKGDKESDKATSESTLGETETALADDTASLEQTDKECKTTTGEWEERSGIREGEIKQWTWLSRFCRRSLAFATQMNMRFQRKLSWKPLPLLIGILRRMKLRWQGFLSCSLKIQRPRL